MTPGPQEANLPTIDRPVLHDTDHAADPLIGSESDETNCHEGTELWTRHTAG